MLFWHKHNIEKSLADLPNFTPFPDEWTVEDKVLFEQAFSFHGKSFHRIQQMVNTRPAGVQRPPSALVKRLRPAPLGHHNQLAVSVSAPGQVHLQSGEVLLLLEKDSLQNQPDGPTGPKTGHQEQPGRQVGSACQQAHGGGARR